MKVISLTGAVGVGKTTVGRALANHLPNTVLTGIDDSDDWPSLIARVGHLRTDAIIESVLMPPRFRLALGQHDTTYVVITCDEDERLRRLSARDETRPIIIPPRTAVDIAFDNTDPLTEERVKALLGIIRP